MCNNIRKRIDRKARGAAIEVKVQELYLKLLRRSNSNLLSPLCPFLSIPTQPKVIAGYNFIKISKSGEIVQKVEGIPAHYNNKQANIAKFWNPSRNDGVIGVCFT